MILPRSRSLFQRKLISLIHQAFFVWYNGALHLLRIQTLLILFPICQCQRKFGSSSGSNPGKLMNPCLNLAMRDSWLTEFPAIKWEIFNSPCTEYSLGRGSWLTECPAIKGEIFHSPCTEYSLGRDSWLTEFPQLNGKYSSVPAQNKVQVVTLGWRNYPQLNWKYSASSSCSEYSSGRCSWLTEFPAIKWEMLSPCSEYSSEPIVLVILESTGMCF
jgi:hypothetical protein